MPRDDLEIARWETLLTPVAGGSDNGLMFPHHRLEILDRLEGDVVLGVAEIDEGASVFSIHWNCEHERWLRLVRRSG